MIVADILSILILFILCGMLYYNYKIYKGIHDEFQYVKNKLSNYENESKNYSENVMKNIYIIQDNVNTLVSSLKNIPGVGQNIISSGINSTGDLSSILESSTFNSASNIASNVGSRVSGLF
jgi:predicted PurR-regulated permease PerM